MKLSRLIILAVIAFCHTTALFAQSSESYDQLMRKYYFTNAMKKLLGSLHGQYDSPVSITRKFDGVNVDWLTVFPVESSRDTDSPNLFSRFVIKSEKGTVPDLYFSSTTQSMDGVHTYPDYFEFGTNEISEDGVSGVSINEFTTLWKAGEAPQPGIVIIGHPEGSTIQRAQSYIYNNGKWEQCSPAIPGFLPMEECLRAWLPYLDYTPQRHSFSCSDLEYTDRTINTEFVVLPGDYIGMNSYNSVLKFGNGIADFSIGSMQPNQFDVRVDKNRWGINNDAIVLTNLATGNTAYLRAFEQPDGASSWNGYSLCEDIFLRVVDSVGNPIEIDE